MDSLQSLRAIGDDLRKKLQVVENAIAAFSGGPASGRKGKKRHLSAAARKKLSEAGKKRWANSRKGTN